MDLVEVLFGKLPGLSGNDHTKSYVLPAVGFVIASLLMLNAFGVQLGLLGSVMPEPLISPQPTPTIPFDSTPPFTVTVPLTSTRVLTPNIPLTTTLSLALTIQSNVAPTESAKPADTMRIFMALVIVALVCWLISTLLLALNNDILRMMAGEGKGNLLGVLWEKSERKRFENLINKMKEAATAYHQCISADEPAHEHHKTYNELLYKLAKDFPNSGEFPPSAEWLMRTPLGNTLRAFEMYSSVMYGLDPSCGWQRLQGVLPDNYRALVNKAKADMDFWMNVCVLSALTLVEFLALALITIIKQQNIVVGWWLLPIFILFFVVISYRRVRKSAEEWGEWIKTAFDLYMPILRNTLGFSAIPKTKAGVSSQNTSPQDIEDYEKERELWRSFSYAVAYQQPNLMPPRPLTQFPSSPDAPAPSPKGLARFFHKLLH